MYTTGNPPVCQGLIEDPDITGVGVRSTFYATSILAVVNACIPGCDIKGSFWAIVFTSLALLVSAVIQARNETISLYNAIIVFYLCYLHVFSSFVVLKVRRWVHRKAIDPKLTVVALLQWLFWGYLATAVLRDISSFGSQPECNSEVTYYWPMYTGYAFRANSMRTPFFWYSLALCLPLPIPFSYLRRVIGHDSVRSALRFLGRHDYEAWKLGLPLFLFVWITVVMTIEETILHNQVNRSCPRFAASFGQIFPVVTIGIPIVSIYYDARAWLQGEVVGGTLSEAAQDTPNIARLVRDNDALSAYATTVMDEESWAVDAIYSSSAPASPPAGAESTTSTRVTLPPVRDEGEPTPDVMFGGVSEIDTRAPCETVAPEHTYPPPQIDQPRSSAAV